MIRFRFRIKRFHLTGLIKAPAILSRQLRGGMVSIGKRLRASSAARMRRDTGREAKSLVIRVSGRGLKLNLLVFSTLIQAFVDAYGLKRGTFPPFGRESRLYQWTARRHKAGLFNINEEKGQQVREVAKVRRRRRGRLAGKFRVLAPTSRRGRGAQVSGRRRRDTNIRRLTFLAARAIYKYGIKPSHWNKRALNANRDRIMRELRNAMARAINEINRT